jgi:pyridoxal phosphate enzyme (YggS family)
VNVGVADRLADVRARIAAAATRAGRDPRVVTLVVVTKEVDLPRVRDAFAAGAREFGENRAQDLVTKARSFASDSDDAPDVLPSWHFIGRLQRNKVRALAPYVSLWESVDRIELGREIAAHAPDAGVLVQVNLAGEPQKGGCAPGDADSLADALREIGLHVEGLMTVPPLGGDPRPWFVRLRSLAADIGLPTLSMGMSGDFEQAVEEGATIVRVGSAVFGTRPSATSARR